MIDKIAERDWKHLHSLQDRLVERYCGQTLSHINYITTSGKFGDNLSQYQEIWQYIEEREKTLVFNLCDFRRSNALIKIEGVRRLRLFTREEFEGFSEELRRFFKGDDAS